MSQKIMRIFATILTGIAVFGVLTGGTYVYRKLTYTDPLSASVTKLQAVDSFTIVQDKSEQKIKVRFNAQEKLRNNFYLLLDQLKKESSTGPQKLTITLDNASNTELEKFLNDAKLPVYEAISTGKFAALPAQLHALSTDSKIIFNLELDSDYIFITAISGDQYAHMIIDRTEKGVNIINTMGGEYL